jgi:hypothetical protein
MMAQFAILSRLKDPENSSIFSKMLVYDGENLKDTDPKAKSMHEYVDYAGVDEGMSGLSTRRLQIRRPKSSTSIIRKWRPTRAPAVCAGTAGRARAVPT